jgi:hypothetical protein
VRGARLNDELIVQTSQDEAYTSNGGFLAQMGDFFTEDVCFHTPKEGEKGERRTYAPPLCQGQSEGPEPCSVGTGGAPTP